MKSTFKMATACVALCSANSVFAQVEPANSGEIQNEEIVVTAQRRDQALSDVPMSIAVVSNESLAKNNVADTSGLVTLAPGLTGKAQGIATPVFAIRGISTNSIGIGGESSIGVFWDEAYLGRLESSNLPLYDIERVEVLKGPQSTLFGRNASAGAISITSRRPTNQLGGDMSVSYGSFDRVEATGGVSIPLSDTLRFRAAGLYRRSDGTERNVLLNINAAGGETIAARGVLVFEPSNDAKFELISNYVRDNGTGFPSETIDPALSALSGVAVDPFDGKHAMDAATFERRRTFASALKGSIDLTDTLSLKSITSYLNTRFDRQFDVDGSALPLLQSRFRDYRNKTFGQELRLVGENGDANWFIGAAYFGEKVSQSVDLTYSEPVILGSTMIPADTFFVGQPAFAVCDEPLTSTILGQPCQAAALEQISGNGRNRSYSVFGDLAYDFSDEFTVTVGGRWSRDNKRFAYEVPATVSVGTTLNGNNLFTSVTAGQLQFQKSWSSFQPRLVLSYDVGPDSLIFASASRGFKAGGFDPTPNPADVAFSSEDVWAYEIGARHQSADRNFRASASLYFQDYRGYQIQVLRGGTTNTINAPRVQSYGGELELFWRPARAVSFEGNVSLNSATFRELASSGVSLRGNRLLYSPTLTAFGAADWSIVKSDDFEISTRVSIRHEGRQFFSKENRTDESSGAVTLADAALTFAWTNPKLQIRLFGRSLLNEQYLIYAVDQGFGVVVNRGEPRSFGVEARISF